MTIYDQNILGDIYKTIILQPKERYCIEMGDVDWSSLSIVTLISITNLASNTHTFTTDSVVRLTDIFSENFYFGLCQSKDSLPGVGNNFIGLSGNQYARFITSHLSHSISDKTVTIGTVSVSTSASVINGNFDKTSTWELTNNQHRIAATNFDTNIGSAVRVKQRFVVQNKGLATQQIAHYTNYNVNVVKPSFDFAVGGLDISDTHRKTYEWNNGSSALTLPKTIIYYCPFSDIRLKLNHIAIKMA